MVRGPHGRGGFVVAIVLLGLAVITLLMVSAYQLIRTTGEIRVASRETTEAELSAEAGMHRFMGELYGTPPDSMVLQLSPTGSVTVKARRLERLTGHRTMYLVSGTAAYGTPYPARRVVREFAMLEPPVMPLAVVSNVRGTVTVNGFVNGADAGALTLCAEPAGDIGGVYAVGGAFGFNTFGTPATQIAPSSASAIAALRARWDFLTSAELPVRYSGLAAWPSFSSLHPDTFPVIRITGNFTPASTHSGRGTLIVTGAFSPGNTFTWNGVIFAGRVVPPLLATTFTLRGLMVTGLDLLGGNLSIPSGYNLQYHRCNVMKAFGPLSHLERVRGAVWTDTR